MKMLCNQWIYQLLKLFWLVKFLQYHLCLGKVSYNELDKYRLMIPHKGLCHKIYVTLKCYNSIWRLDYCLDKDV